MYVYIYMCVFNLFPFSPSYFRAPEVTSIFSWVHTFLTPLLVSISQLQSL